MSRNILTICLGNHCRSPMAEGILAHLARQQSRDWNVRSAGITGLVSVPAHAHAVTAMREVGIDIHGYLGDQLSATMIEASDHVLVMEPWHATKVTDLVPSAGDKVVLLDEDSVPDPMGHDLEMFRAVRDQLLMRIEAWAASLPDA